MRKFLANAGEYDERKTKTYGSREREEDAFQKRRIVLGVELGGTQHGAVRGDERQEYAERRMQRRQKALHRNVNELHERGDHENEHKRVDVP